MKSPLIIGITGGIGSGKSTLANNLRAEGYYVYDSDLEARRLQNDYPVMREQIQALFGDDIYTSKGLNRYALAQIVFADRNLLAQLNDIVHPILKEDFKKWIKDHNSEKFLFIEAAILFECGYDVLVDKVVLITAPESVRIERVVKRDGVTPEHVRARMLHQIPEEDKILKSNFVIYSNDNQQSIYIMKKIIDELMNYISESE